MTSKEDDTLPLPVLSQELSADVTVDEDFIPTSQPQGSGCSKISKNSETSDRFTEESNSSGGLIDDTLPREAIINSTTFDKDRSADFILDTEAKKIQIIYPKEELSCRKKLPVFADGDNACAPQSNPLWDTQTPQIPESPFSILNDSPAEERNPTVAHHEKSITEIIVNDSAETVDLDSSPSKGVKSETANKLNVSCSIDSDVGRCEEIQIFDNSSVLLLDQPGASLIADQSEKSIKDSSSQNLYFVKTVEDSESDLQEQVNLVVSECTPPALESSRSFQTKEEVVMASPTKKNGVSEEGLKEEGQMNGNAEGKNNSLVATRQIDFNLKVTCFVTFDTKTKKVLQKFISKVNEQRKTLPKPIDVDLLSDHPSDKSKRYSTSSSGSVYSDKLGLPFPLPKRVSAVSDQTDSSEDDFGLRIKQRSKAFARVPWSNEYLFPLKLDELVQRSFESQALSEWPEESSALKKTKSEHNVEVFSPKKTIKSSFPDSKFDSRSSEEAAEKETPEPVFPEVEEKVEDAREEDKAQCGRHGEREKSVPDAVVEGGEDAEEKAAQTEAPRVEDSRQQEEETSVVLCEGLPVLARWTDKRYYSGVLCGIQKNDRWEVKFDDGTSKTVREDFLMPTEWLKVGALVFALVDDKYESGQIIGVEKGNEVTYSVELDEEKKKISTKLSDLCLTDVMASIVREKYKPLSGTPRGKADIDFDNVLSGKRLREQRTPLRPPKTVRNGSSGPKKKSSSKGKIDESRGLETIEETSEYSSTGRRTTALRSSNGHLVEDKVASAESPSGNEIEATPLRTVSDPSRSKPKPRTLSYGRDDAPAVSSWLGPDGSPIAGSSGLQTRRQRTAKDKDETDDADEPPAKKSATKAKRKRKMDDSSEDGVSKKSLKKGDVGTKTRSKKR